MQVKIENRDDGRSKPDVSIITINWNTADLLEQCLESIVQSTKNISYEIIIIDNDSEGKDFKKVKEKFSEYTHFTWIENDKNIGASAANQAMPLCQGKYLLILGPDTIVKAGTFEKMVDFLDNNKEAGAVTAKLLNPDGSPQNYYYKFWNLPMVFLSTMVGRAIDKIFFRYRLRRYYFGGNIDAEKLTVVEQPAAACFMLRPGPVTADYLIDENFPFYYNDVDLCKRIYDSGSKILLLPFAEVIHFQSSAFKKVKPNWVRKEWRSSLIKYFKKHHKNKVIFLRLILLLDDVVPRFLRF